MPPTDTSPEAPTPEESPSVPLAKGTDGPTPRKDGSDAPGIHFEKVVKRFGDNVVLRELDFEVAPGERVTLIGPSGSGKTTILRLLMTLEKVNDGVIRVGDEPLSHMDKGGRLVPANEKHLHEMRKKIGMVFQQFNLFPNMSVMRNITEAPMRVLGLSKDEAAERAHRLLDLVGLPDKANAHPTQLSGGQQQRVAIARACAMEPQVLLLDEVTSALDPELVVGVQDLLRDIALQGDLTVLCVTHEMGFAKDISDRVLMFDQGQIVEEGPPDQIFGEPTEQRTRDFLQAVLAS
jgi:polar amino acid transport system ATP-binding protein